MEVVWVLVVMVLLFADVAMSLTCYSCASQTSLTPWIYPCSDPFDDTSNVSTCEVSQGVCKKKIIYQSGLETMERLCQYADFYDYEQDDYCEHINLSGQQRMTCVCHTDLCNDAVHEQATAAIVAATLIATHCGIPW